LSLGGDALPAASEQAHADRFDSVAQPSKKQTQDVDEDLYSVSPETAARRASSKLQAVAETPVETSSSKVPKRNRLSSIGERLETASSSSALQVLSDSPNREAVLPTRTSQDQLTSSSSVYQDNITSSHVEDIASPGSPKSPKDEGTPRADVTPGGSPSLARKSHLRGILRSPDSPKKENRVVTPPEGQHEVRRVKSEDLHYGEFMLAHGPAGSVPMEPLMPKSDGRTRHVENYELDRLYGLPSDEEDQGGPSHVKLQSRRLQHQPLTPQGQNRRARETAEHVDEVRASHAAVRRQLPNGVDPELANSLRVALDTSEQSRKVATPREVVLAEYGRGSIGESSKGKSPESSYKFTSKSALEKTSSMLGRKWRSLRSKTPEDKPPTISQLRMTPRKPDVGKVLAEKKQEKEEALAEASAQTRKNDDQHSEASQSDTHEDVPIETETRLEKDRSGEGDNEASVHNGKGKGVEAGESLSKSGALGEEEATYPEGSDEWIEQLKRRGD